jgi:hypothetical protein
MKLYGLWVPIGIASATVAAVSILSPYTIFIAGQSQPGASEARQAADDESQRAAKLRAREGLAEERLRQRTRIVEEVIAGRLSLAQAAARFLRLNKATPECMSALRGLSPGVADEQIACEQVIYAVGIVLEDRREPSAAVLDRLRGALRELLDRPSGLTLPEAED